MTTHDYESTVRACVTPDDAFNKIANVSAWWTKGTTGSAKRLGDTFKVDWASRGSISRLSKSFLSKKSCGW